MMKIEMTKRAVRDLERLPGRIVKKIHNWIRAVTRLGLQEVREIPGYHDEPLQGARFGQRSVRFNRSYRGIYKIQNDKEAETLQIVEITKHRY